MQWIANASTHGPIDECFAEGERLFAGIAKDESESLDTRAAACFALTTKVLRNPGFVTSNHVNYVRRFLFFVDLGAA